MELVLLVAAVLAAVLETRRAEAFPLAPRPSPLRCPYCRSDLELREAWACPGCGTEHHEACLAENGRCTVLGCAAPAPPGLLEGVSRAVMETSG